MSQDVMVSVRDVCAAMGVEYTGSIADCLKRVYELSLRAESDTAAENFASYERVKKMYSESVVIVAAQDEIIRIYGRHAMECNADQWRLPGDPYNYPICTCGLSGALAALRKLQDGG